VRRAQRELFRCGSVSYGLDGERHDDKRRHFFPFKKEPLAFVGVLERRLRRHPQRRHYNKEQSMLDTSFASPVAILVGMGFPLEIRSVMDALRYLDEQPALLRDEAYHATYGACRDALECKVSVMEARDVFCALARRRGILIDEMWAQPATAGASTSLNA